MESFAPELSHLWLQARDARGGTVEERAPENTDDRSQAQALEELAERVTAARSVV